MLAYAGCRKADTVPRSYHFQSHWRARLTAAFCLMAFASPALAVAHDGSWAQVGVPFRFAAPLLWDGAERRLLGIGADAFGAGDSIEDAWEFREAAGWRRIRLPQPPAGLALGLWGPVADPARRRYVQLAYEDSGYDRLRLWALELLTEPRWVCLDSSSSAPTGPHVEDLDGSSIWVETFADYPRGPELWGRSLADTGQWRLVRELPNGGPGFESFVDAVHDRLVAVGVDSDSTMVWLLPLSGSKGWTQVSAGFPAPPKKYPRMVVPDAARERLLWFVEDVNQPGNNEVWSLDLAGAPRWEFLGAAEYRLDHEVTAIAGDSLVLHGQGDAPGAPGARTIAIPMNDPRRARTLFDPVWPRASRGDILVRDASEGRWLLVGGAFPGEGSNGILGFLGGPLDSLWELKRPGASTIWRRVAIDGAIPARSGSYLLTVDENEGTLYLLNGWNTAQGTPQGVLELWGLRTSDPPGWELLATGGADNWPRLGCGVFVFDSVRRRLVCFGYEAPGAGQPSNEVWEFDVVRASGWSRSIAAGQPIGCAFATTAAFDAASSRVVALGVSGEVPILVTSPELRWEGVACPDYTTDPCLAATRGRGAVHDPIGRRLLALGNYDPFWPTVGPGSSLFEVSVGSSVGVARLLETIGTPGGQAAPTFGYDPERDALLVYGIRKSGTPTLQEYLFNREARLLAKTLGCRALNDRIALRWAATPDETFMLWRLAPGEEWAFLASISASASGELTFDDRAIESGARYGYRLTTPASELEPTSADIWLTATSSGTVTLSAPWPNPAHGALNVAFTTLAASPTELDVFDIAGRRVWSRRWDTPAAGPHHVAINSGELPRSGLYFLRLRQAGLTLTRRVVLAP